MSYQKSFILGLIVVLLTSVSMGQEKKKVVKVKAGGHDKMKNHIIIKHDESLSDSSMKKIFIHKMPRHEKKARIVIKKSGFFRKNKIVIDFDPYSNEIVAVTDNDKEISESKFHKYQDYLDDAGDMEEMESLHEKMEELEWVIEAGDMDDSLKIMNLEIMLDDLESMESDLAKMKKEQYIVQKRIIELDELTDLIQDVMAESGMTPPQKIKEIKIEDGKFWLNGEEITGEVGKKCIAVWEKHAGHEAGELHGERMSVHIKFD